jgi:PEGA domain-containing protein
LADPLLAFSSEEDTAAHRMLAAAETLREKAWVVAIIIAAVAIAAVAGWSYRVRSVTPVAPEPGRLAVATRPSGVTVAIDGVSRGTTPITMSLSAGAHTMVLRRATDERTVPFNVTSGEQVSQYFEFAAVLLPPSVAGTLSVTLDRGTARVVVDGRPAGISPVALRGLAPGEHIVAITTDNGKLERRVTVEPGATTSVVFSAPPSAGATAGWIAITSPFEVQVFQGDELVGSSAATKIMMTAGRHDLRFTNAALAFDDRRRIDVTAGKTSAVRISAPTASVSINAKPWADVLVDGGAFGQTPLANVPLAIGTHQVTFHHPQLGDRSQTVVVSLAGPNRVSADYTKP